MNKKLIFLLFLMPLFGQLYAQNDDEVVNLDSIFPMDPYYYQLAADTCHAPFPTVMAVIHYEGYSKAYLELDGMKVGSVAQYKLKESSGSFLETAIQNGKVVLNNLQPNSLYSFEVANNCGKMVEAFTINTKTEPEPMVTVSNRFYDKITKYLSEGNNVPFQDFLADLTEVNPYEQTAFIQQFFYKGQPFTEDLGEAVPPLPKGGEKDSCFCNSIRTSELALPALQNPDGTITEFSQPGSSATPTTLGGDSNTQTWYWLNNKGAAKWHQLHTDGFKAKKGVDYDRLMTWVDSTVISYQKSWIRITFLCLDGDRIPKECECEKTVRFWYRYDTRVTAVAEILSDGTSASKNAIAQVEDMAIATFREEFNPTSFKVLDAVMSRVESHCDRSVNPAYWTNMAQLLGNATKIALAVMGSGSTVTQLTQVSDTIIAFFNGIATQINTPYNNPTNCDNFKEEFGSFEGETAQILRPNKPSVLAINSFDKLYSGGRRSWSSYARIVSDFHITAIINHNAYDHTPIHCCSPMVGVWILGSCDGPRTTEQLKIEVAEKLYLAGMNNLPASNQGNGYTVPGEFGYLWQRSSLEDCNKIVVNPGGHNTGGGRPSNINRDSNLEDLKDFKSLSVWDLTGKLISEFDYTDISDYSNITEIVNARLSTVVPGIYFIKLVANGTTATQKIIIH